MTYGDWSSDVCSSDLFTGPSRCTLWQAEQNSGESCRMNAFMKVWRCGAGFRYVMKRSILRTNGSRLDANLCSGGYRIVKPPLPIELSTSTMEWQETHPKPFWASGVSSCSLIGLSKRPLKNTA